MLLSSVTVVALGSKEFLSSVLVAESVGLRRSSAACPAEAAGQAGQAGQASPAQTAVCSRVHDPRSGAYTHVRAQTCSGGSHLNSNPEPHSL